jgi:hypothetical protein
VGQWGKRYAVRCLQEELLSKYSGAVVEETANGFRLRCGDSTVAEVVWLNRFGEQGVGYDIEVIEGTSRLFVEVKSIRDDARTCFDLSEAQWEMAQATGLRTGSPASTTPAAAMPVPATSMTRTGRGKLGS